MAPSILVVEDDLDLGESLTEILRGSGYEVAWVESGRAAMEFLNRREVGLIISDYLMKNGDGMELLRHVRARNQVRPPFILMTGQSRVPPAEAKNMGAQEIVTKPFDVARLLQTIRDHLTPG